MLKKEQVNLNFNQLCLEDIIARIPQHVFWKDTNFIYQGCNQNFALAAGLTRPEDIIGKTDYELPWGKANSDIYRQEDEQVLFSGQPILDREVNLFSAEGKSLIISVSKVPLYNAQNKIIGLIGIYSDITEKKQQEEQKAAFLNVVSHEIRGPLNNIQGLAQSLNMAKNINEQCVIQAISDVVSEVKRATGLLSDMVDLFDPNFTKDDARYIDNVSLPEVIDSITPEINFKPKTKFMVEVSSSVPGRININVIKLRNILKILLQNSAEQTKQGFIKLLVNVIHRENKPGLYIEMLDTSAGIYPENKDYVFNALGAHHQLDKDFLYHKPHIKLTMAKRLIESMGGSISLLGHPGKGAEIEIVIPYQLASTGKIVASNIYTPPDSTRDNSINMPVGLKVLVVEDDKITNQLLSEMFKQLKCKVKQVYTGQDALASLQKQKYDLISLDITLPDINGAQVLKQLPQEPAPAVIAITSHATKADVDYLYSQGFMAVLTKPVNQEDIESLLEAYARMLQDD